MRVCVRVRACMHVLQFLHHVFMFFLLILYEKIIMLHKARCVKKNGVGKGRRCRQKKKKKKKKKEYQTFLSDYFHFLVIKFSVYLNRHVFVMVYQK